MYRIVAGLCGLINSNTVRDLCITRAGKRGVIYRYTIDASQLCGTSIPVYCTYVSCGKVSSKTGVTGNILSSDQSMDDMYVHRNPCNGDQPDLSKFHDAVLKNNVDVVKQMLDAGLDPNNTIPAGLTENNTCAGYTLLYMACVYDKMDIVKMLLKAGADPNKRNGLKHLGFYYVAFYMKVGKPSSFFYAITERNTELMRVLLRENTVHINKFFRPHFPGLNYGIFRVFCDDEDVMKVIMEVGTKELIKPARAPRNDPAKPDLVIFLHTAAKYRSEKLFRYLMDYCGKRNAINALLHLDNRSMKFDEYHVTDTLSYLIDLHGARSFIEDDSLTRRIMSNGSCRMLQLLMNLFYQFYGDNKEWWREQMISKWRDDRSFVHHVLYAYSTPKRARFESLLRWGVYSVLHDFPHKYSVYYVLAQSWQVESTNLFISLYPKYLQESWLWEADEPWHRNNNNYIRPTKRYSREEMAEIESYFTNLVEKRRHVPTLQVLCRSVIFHELEINPIPKAEQLPLPRILKDFVQCKELFEANKYYQAGE